MGAAGQTGETISSATQRAPAGVFADFLGDQHGLAEAMRSDEASFQVLHDCFIGRLVPRASLLEAPAAAGETRGSVDALGLMFAVGNLCAGARDPATRRAPRCTCSSQAWASPGLDAELGRRTQ